MRKDLITHLEPKAHVSELFRTLRTNIQFMNSNKGLNSLLVTSTLPEEGKTWIASNLAIAFAQADKKVVLIDADMRKCSLHTLFNVTPYPGLSNYLAGVNENESETQDLANYIRFTKVPNLYLMPSGNIPPNPSELLGTPQMAELLEILKKEFDLIIIDGTPSKLVTDAVILSRLVDSTLVVVGHNMAKKDDFSKVVRDIKNVGGKIAGIVYNKKPTSSKKENERYYYSLVSSKDSKKKYEFESKKMREEQHSVAASEMLERDRNPVKYVRDAIKEVGNVTNKISEINNANFQAEGYNSANMLNESTKDKTSNMLKQLNEYLENEKRNMNNNKNN